MKDSLTSNNHHDFRARYQSTFGYYVDPDTGKRLPVFVANCNQYRVTFNDIDGRELHVKVDSGIEFEFIPVDRGFFQVDEEVYYLERVPARQWKRGICNENTRPYSLTDALHSCLANYLHIISKMYPINCSTAWRSSKEGYPVALSKHFAISAANVLYFYNKEIGTVDHTTDTIKLNNDMLLQEVTDLFRRNNLNVKVSA